MFERLGSWTYRFRFVILAAWVVGAVFMAASRPSLAGQGSTDQTTFLPANAPSRAAKDAIERAFPGSTSSVVRDDHHGPARAGLTDADRHGATTIAAWVVSDEAPAELRRPRPTPRPPTPAPSSRSCSAPRTARSSCS